MTAALAADAMRSFIAPGPNGWARVPVAVCHRAYTEHADAAGADPSAVLDVRTFAAALDRLGYTIDRLKAARGRTTLAVVGASIRPEHNARAEYNPLTLPPTHYRDSLAVRAARRLPEAPAA